MRITLINIGFGNIVSANKILAIVKPDSAPVKRLINDAKKAQKLIDATCGRRTRSVIVCENENLILSALQPETVAQRILSMEETT